MKKVLKSAGIIILTLILIYSGLRIYYHYKLKNFAKNEKERIEKLRQEITPSIGNANRVHIGMHVDEMEIWLGETIYREMYIGTKDGNSYDIESFFKLSEAQQMRFFGRKEGDSKFMVVFKYYANISDNKDNPKVTVVVVNDRVEDILRN